MRRIAFVVATAVFASGCGGGSSDPAPPPPPVVSAASSTLAVSAGTAVANGTATITATATIKDQYGAPMPGVTVTFAATGCGNAWTPASAVTNGSGVATAALSSTVVGARTVSVTAGTTAIPQTQSAAFLRPLTADLVISEVGNRYYSDVPAWFEIHNGTAAAVNLSGYTVRTAAYDPGTSATAPETTFTLPSVSVPAGGYAVVAGKTSTVNYDGGLLVHVSDASGRLPYWFGSGYVELLKAGATVDFVRFGADTTTPTTAGAWSGAGATVFPTGATSYSYTLARRPVWAATRTSADWVQVRFPTPGGPNDVAPGAVDTDADGIPDSAKALCGTFAGLDLYALGARPGKRDVFIELDGMESTDAGVLPLTDALDPVVAKFAAHGIALHIDAGARYSTSFNPVLYNLGQTDWNVPSSTCINFPGVAGCGGDIYAYKAQHMDLPRRGIFHYLLFGTSQLVDGTGGSSGRADIVGSNFLVTLGGWGLSVSTVTGRNLTVNFQASTLMHELGHNIGLRHGGDENLNYKPNYLSIMNYLYQLAGLSDPASAAAGDRYVADVSTTTVSICTLDASPCGSPGLFRMDYSNGSGAALDETAVNETAGLGRPGSHWVDFNLNGTLDLAAYSLNLIPSWGAHTLGLLHDYDDWTNLRLPFQSGAAWVLGGANPRTPASLIAPVRPFDDHTRELSNEAAPPARFFEALRREAR